MGPRNLTAVQRERWEDEDAAGILRPPFEGESEMPEVQAEGNGAHLATRISADADLPIAGNVSVAMRNLR
jgi:hypothetical protein